jgi:RNA polymerase sigma-70 factor
MNYTAVFCRLSILNHPAATEWADYRHLLGQALCKYDTAALSDNHIESIESASRAGPLQNLSACEADLAKIYGECALAYPDFAVSIADFTEGVTRAIDKYLVKYGARDRVFTAGELRQFINELQSPDLYLALACARGNEQAWWEFDRRYRPFIERLARHLVGNRAAADEAVDFVYAELFGTSGSGESRQSKFKTYTGRGTLRGWLRAVVWHALVDLFRGRADEISLDQCYELDDEARSMRIGATPVRSVEDVMLENVVRERYRSVTLAALDHALAELEPHETLLLMYYYIDGLKLREIARLIENPTSPMRRWFKRSHDSNKQESHRIHESTVMRWLEKAYRKISQAFHTELRDKHGLKNAEIELCMSIATADLGQTVSLRSETLERNKAATSKVEGL